MRLAAALWSGQLAGSLLRGQAVQLDAGQAGASSVGDSCMVGEARGFSPCPKVVSGFFSLALYAVARRHSTGRVRLHRVSGR